MSQYLSCVWTERSLSSEEMMEGLNYNWAPQNKPQKHEVGSALRSIRLDRFRLWPVFLLVFLPESVCFWAVFTELQTATKGILSRSSISGSDQDWKKMFLVFFILQLIQRNESKQAGWWKRVYQEHMEEVWSPPLLMSQPLDGENLHWSRTDWRLF